MVAPTWHVEVYETICDWDSAKAAGSPEAAIINHTPKPTPTQPVNTGMYLNMSTINPASAQVAGRIKYFQVNLHLIKKRPLGVGDCNGLQHRSSYNASLGGLAPHHVDDSTRVCSSGSGQDGTSGCYPPSNIQYLRGVCLQYFSCRKEGWWLPLSYKSQESELFCGFPTWKQFTC